MKRSFHVLVILTLYFFKLNSQSWVELDGPLSIGISHSIITRESGMIFALTSSGEIFTSTDQATTWTDATAGIVYDNSFIWSNNRNKFVESDDGTIFLSYKSRFYQFDSNRRYWNLKNDSINLTDYVIGPTGIIYAGNSKAFYISYDQGLNFNKIMDWDAPKLSFDCQGNGNNFVILDSRNNASFSFEDDGSQFKMLNMVVPNSQQLIYERNSGNLISLSSTGIYISKNFGVSWVKIVIPGFAGIFYNGKILKMPNGNLLYFGYNTYISYDGGLNWHKDPFYYSLSLELIHGKINDDYSMVYKAEDSLYTFFIDKTKAQNPFIIPVSRSRIHQIICYEENKILCTTDQSDYLHVSKDNGLNWNISITPDLMFYTFKESLFDWKGNYYDLEGSEVLIFNVEDLSYTVRDYPFNWIEYKDGFISKSGKIFLYDGKAMYVSEDKALSWKVYPTKFIVSNDRLKCSANDIIYYSSRDTIFYSLDYGLTWPYFKSKNSLLEITNISKKNIIYWLEDSGTSYHLISSADFGKTRTLEDTSYSRPFLVSDDDTKYYLNRNSDSIKIKHLGSTDYEYISFDGLNFEWNKPNRFTLGENGYLYYYTPDSKLFKSIKSTTKTNHISNNLFTIQANPNPVYKKTLVTLPNEFQGFRKKWLIYNIIGNVIFEQENIENELIFETKNLSSGLYIIKVVAENNLIAKGKILINQ